MSNVQLVARTVPTVEGVMTEDFTAYVARIGKVKDNPDKLIKYLIKHKHWSPFQHTYFSFKLRTSRAIGREILRHWSMDHQELSQRYEEIMEFEPIELRKQSENNRQSSEEVFNPRISYNEPDGDVINEANNAVKDVLNTVRSLYQSLLEAGVARECARMILPECTSTTMLLTGNIRSWIGFLSLRCAPESQKEMQILANQIKDILVEEVPVIFK